MVAKFGICFLLLQIVHVFANNISGDMSDRTVLNEDYNGELVNMFIPVEIHESDGQKYASVGSVVPVHRCTIQQIQQYSRSTYFYCDIFTQQLLAPPGEVVYVRLDDNTAEKVSINRTRQILLTSSDGVLAQWRAAPTFESENQFIAGTPIVNDFGEIVSIVTAKSGNYYAVSTFDGAGGYFSTPEQWRVFDTPDGANVYGDHVFATRAELRKYIASLPGAVVTPENPPTPILHQGQSTRIALIAKNGNQISHQYLHEVISNAEYL